MKCPVCKDVTLLMSEKNGIEIDYCPECRGVWLDRGELEKIVERMKESETQDYDDKRSYEQNRHSYDQGRHPYDQGRHPYDQGKYPYDHGKYPYKKRKSSMLGEIFGVFGGEDD